MNAIPLNGRDHRESVAILADKLRRQHSNRPIFLLGAGSSVSSGVPTASELVWLIGRHAYAERVKGSVNALQNVMQTDARHFLGTQNWFDVNMLPECFPLAVQHLLRPQSVRRQFFQQHTRHHSIGEGYRSLGRLCQRQLCRTILTTNFDSVLREALHEHKQQLHEIVEVNQVQGDLTLFNVHRRCQIVYLHGSIDHYTDCNLPDEIQQLSQKLASRLWPTLADSPLIVVGYRGAEPSIVQHLLGKGVEESAGFKYGIYWCCRNPGEVHPQVAELAKKLPQNFSLLKIDGFDELMRNLDQELAGETCLIETHADDALSQSWDRKPLTDGSMDEIDTAALLSTLADYCEHLQLGKLDPSRLEKMLLDRQLAVQHGERIVPTNACLLLFGKDPQKRFPHAVVTIVSEQRRQSVFAGNLLRQLRDLRANLQISDINPTLRLKNETGAQDILAYAPRAITELVANMLVHRDYEVEEFSVVSHAPGLSLEFVNPGGLVPAVAQKLVITDNGNFEPVLGVSDCRNPVIADLFCGIREIDKQGSGLPDVQAQMPKHGGRAEFRVRDSNTSLEARLLQAEQQSASQSTAVRRTQTDVYTTNLLPFRLLPEKIYCLPIGDPELRRPIFESDDERAHLPMCLIAGGWMISFTDLRTTPEFTGRHGMLGLLEEWSLREFLEDEVRARHFVWLLGHYWNRHLAHFEGDGLYNDFHRKRAYFCPIPGKTRSITYTSWLGRKARREVVKERGEERKFHENEGFFYRIVEMGGEWAIQLNPTYVFTEEDGRTPIPQRLHSSRSTRRMKFDRNKMVGDDLMFWSRYIGRENEALNLGSGWADDVILDMRFVFAELPTATVEAPA